MQIKNKNLFNILILIFLLTACAAKRDWQMASVINTADKRDNVYVFAGKNFYFDRIYAKEKIDDKMEILLPENVKTVENENYKYVRMYFDEENFGMESYGFGKVLAEKAVMLVETKYKQKTCACKTSGSYSKGYFFVFNNYMQQIETDKKLNILNKSSLLKFLDKHSEIDIPQNVNTINELVAFIKNINN
ncbi:hypothetical protein LJC11_02525 [Bacteroidales bacterium OttesenSCG-928-I21]|nr:hypothetical protein [Bacteroidales bacterium OttesenSCG-928-I21]